MMAFMSEIIISVKFGNSFSVVLYLKSECLISVKFSVFALNYFLLSPNLLYPKNRAFFFLSLRRNINLRETYVFNFKTNITYLI